MKTKTIILFILCFMTSLSFGQRRYVMWFMPSKAQQIYGLTLNPWISEYNLSKKLTIYGGHIQFSPVSPFVIFINATQLLRTDYFESDPGIFEYYPCQSARKKIYGINLAITDWGFSELSGLDLNIGTSEINSVKGLSISGFYNVNTLVKGVSIAGICNKSKYCKGLEIALINNSLQLQGIQIGLWNINQKRSLPFINWCFKKNKLQPTSGI